MAKINLPTAYAYDYVLPVELGGLGSSDVAQAADNIGLVTTSTLNAPNGILALDANGNVSESSIPPGTQTVPDRIIGPLKVATNQVAIYNINNYDSNRTYNVSVSAGTISRSGRTLTLTAPSSVQTITLTINNRAVNIDIVTLVSVTPVIIYPTNGATGLGKNLEFQSSSYSPTDPIDYHVYSDWEIATDTGFSNIVKSSYSDSVNLTKIVFKNLTASTVYYVRVRYKSYIHGVSPWASFKQFTISANDVISILEQTISSNDKKEDEVYGWTVCISQDGTRMVAGGPGIRNSSNVITGGVHVYVFNNTTKKWDFEQKITEPLGSSYTLFGRNAVLDQTGTRLAVAGPNQNNGAGITAVGVVYVFLRTGTTWALEATLRPSDGAFKDWFGDALTIDDTGTRIAVGEPRGTVGTNVAQGAVYVYSRSGTTWTQEQKITDAAGTATSFFGRSVDISGNGSYLIIGSPAKDVGGTRNSGAALVYLRSGTTWALQATLSATDKAAGDLYGSAVAISQAGDKAIIGAPKCTISGVTYAGAVYVHTRSGTTWSFSVKLSASDKTDNMQFGSNVDLNSTGTKMVVGANNKQVGSNPSAGGAYVLFFNGTSWVEELILSAADGSRGDKFGWCVAIDSIGKNIAIGAPQKNSDYVLNSGGIYTFI